jgi:hypothetical protein
MTLKILLRIKGELAGCGLQKIFVAGFWSESFHGGYSSKGFLKMIWVLQNELEGDASLLN